MYELCIFRIKDILPELTQECNLTAKQITENDNAAIDTFLDLSTTIMRKPDYCCKIKEYDMIFKKIMKEKGITWDDLKDVKNVLIEIFEL